MKVKLTNPFTSIDQQIIAALVKKLGGEVELTVDEITKAKGVVYFIKDEKVYFHAS